MIFNATDLLTDGRRAARSDISHFAEAFLFAAKHYPNSPTAFFNRAMDNGDFADDPWNTSAPAAWSPGNPSPPRTAAVRHLISRIPIDLWRRDYCTRENAERAVNLMYNYLVNNLGHWPLGKAIRPWLFANRDFSVTIPENNVLMGVEIEFGFISEQQRRVAKKWAYDEEDVVVDPEGGEFGVEVTFSPKLHTVVAREDSQPIRYLNFIRERVREHSPGRMIGTHVNISTNAIRRTGTSDYLNQANNILNDLVLRSANSSVNAHRALDIQNTTDLVRVQTALFGRIPYGSLHRRGPGTNGRTWVEGKLFNSTTNIDYFRHYLRVSAAIARCLDTFLGFAPTHPPGRLTVPAEVAIDTIRRELRPLVASSPIPTNS